MNKDVTLENNIVKQISSLINKKHLYKSALIVQQNKGDRDTIVIEIENTPWRNGAINGDLLFAKIKTGGNVQYIQIKDTYSDAFTDMNILYTSNSSEAKEGLIRIDLIDFCNLLNNPTAKFVETINSMYLNNISFNSFGCCSKHSECCSKGMCLHTDQLYATACQWQKHLKWSIEYEEIRAEAT